MAEISTAGYSWIRGLMKAQTVYLALYDDLGSQIGSRSSVSGGAWSENGTTLTITKQYAGTAFTLPQTVKSSRIYDAASGGNALTALENFAEGVATLRANEDTITVYHSIQVPA